MKIVAPLRDINEAEMLLHFGADEIYCGVTTPEWNTHFGRLWWMNRRDPSSANILSFTAIKNIVEVCREKKANVYVTLNAPFYPRDSIDYLLKLVEKLSKEARVDGIIVSDLNFLLHLSKENFPVRIHLSSLSGCMNSYGIDFYKSLGVKRIILPRQLKLSEIKALVQTAGFKMEFEVFAVNDGCYYEEGFCQTTHSLGPFCLADWEVDCYPTARITVSPEERNMNTAHYREYLWYQNNCGSSFTANGLPNGPCSLCWFGHFRDWGVKAVKIVGREASFQRKMSSLQLVKTIMDEVRTRTPPEEIASLSRDIRNTPEFCSKGYMCYFRES